MPQVLATRTAPANRAAAARAAGLVVLGTAALTLAAHLQVPFWPVKLSMQTFVAVMLGLVYGPRLGAATVVAYLVAGASGLPVFQSGGGLAYMAGPTGGFLVGLVLAAFLAGWAAERGALARLPTALGAILLATAAVYAPGLAWLAVLLGPEKAVAFGLTPFVPGEILKMGLALALTPLLRGAARVG